eukprot:scaffold5996_cov49-Attheya_sp.AAC.3
MVSSQRRSKGGQKRSTITHRCEYQFNNLCPIHIDRRSEIRKDSVSDIFCGLPWGVVCFLHTVLFRPRQNFVFQSLGTVCPSVFVNSGAQKELRIGSVPVYFLRKCYDML